MAIAADLTSIATLTFEDGTSHEVKVHLVVTDKRSRRIQTAAGKFTAHLTVLDAAVKAAVPLHLDLQDGPETYILVSRHDGKEATFITTGPVHGI